MSKPFIPAAERNAPAILAVLRELFGDRRRVLELGAGTGQHAVHFAGALSGLVWQTSDLPERLAGIRLWLNEAALPNTPPPLALDAARPPWPIAAVDAVYAANLVHFMAWPDVAAMFGGIAAVLAGRGPFALYGPFNVGGRFVSAGNRALDDWLRAENPAFGIRDIEALDALGRRHGLALCEDHALPANNRLLVWRDRAGPGGTAQ